MIHFFCSGGVTLREGTADVARALLDWRTLLQTFWPTLGCLASLLASRAAAAPPALHSKRGAWVVAAQAFLMVCAYKIFSLYYDWIIRYLISYHITSIVYYVTEIEMIPFQQVRAARSARMWTAEVRVRALSVGEDEAEAEAEAEAKKAGGGRSNAARADGGGSASTMASRQRRRHAHGKLSAFKPTSGVVVTAAVLRDTPIRWDQRGAAVRSRVSFAAAPQQQPGGRVGGGGAGAKKRL
jgi:hypothetical protein